MKKFSPWLAGLVGLFVIFAIYLYASPYIVLNSIKNAVQAEDADKLSGYIDFPSVKESMKEQVKAAMMKEVVSSNEKNGFEALGTMLATAMIDPIVDSMITPAGIGLMLEGKSMDLGLDRKESKPEIKAKDLNLDYKAGYVSFNRFKVEIINPDQKTINVIMDRDGLSWKVTRLDFSLDELTNNSNDSSASMPVENEAEDSVSDDYSFFDQESQTSTNEIDSSTDVVAGTNTGNGVSGIWNSGFGMGYVEYSISDGAGRTLWVVCNVGAGEDRDHGVNLEINGNSYQNTDSEFPLTFVVDERIQVTPPGTTNWRNGASAWDEFAENIAKARKIDIYLNDEKVTTINPTVASIKETAESIAECQSMLYYSE